MIINNNKVAEVATHGVNSSIDMTIDDSSREVLMQILSKGLYSDPIGSIIREWSSNALDATREAGVDKPIIVSLKEDEMLNWKFSVQDFGTGMSPDRVINVVSKYAASTKRDRGDQLGYFGLGMKSGLAYADSFNIDTNYDGTKYLYIMYEGEEGTKIDLLSETSTTEENGTTISIMLKEYSDVSEFIEKIQEQLCYFEGIYFDVPSSSIDNNFKMMEGKDWKFSEMNTDNLLHICLDSVYYPLDYQKLGIDNIHLPIGLNFKVTDGIVPIPNREAIRLTPQVKEKILEKIRVVAEDFVNRYNSRMGECKDIVSAWPLIGNSSPAVTIDEQDFYISDISEYCSIPLKAVTIEGITLLDITTFKGKGRFILDQYYRRGEIYRGVHTKKLEFLNCKDLYSEIVNKESSCRIIICKDAPTKVIVDYLKETSKNKRVILISTHSSRKLWGKDSSYYYALNLYGYPRTQWRQVITEYQLIESQFIGKCEKLEDIHPTAEWLQRRKDSRSKGIRTVVTKEQISPKEGRPSDRNGKWKTTFDKGHPTDILSLRSQKGFNIYFMEKDEATRKKIDALQLIFANGKWSSKATVWALTERDYIKMQVHKIHNWIKFEDFMKGEFKVFGRYCTEELVHRFIGENSNMFRYSSIEYISLLDSELAENMKILEKYLGKHICHSEDILIQEMIQICEVTKSWDDVIIEKLNTVKEKLEKMNFLNFFRGGNGYNGGYLKESLELAKEILKARKYKLNLECYEQPKKEEPIMDEQKVEAENKEESSDEELWSPEDENVDEEIYTGEPEEITI